MNRPKIRKEGSMYVFRPTEEAKKIKYAPRQMKKAISQEEVHDAALNRAHKTGIKSPDANTARGFYEIQLGEYHGQTFRWLVENDMGFVTFLLTQVEREGGNTGSGNLNDNKRQLKWYVESFPDGRAALAQRRRENEHKETARKQKSSLVTGNLPPSEVARRLQKGALASRVTPIVPSPLKKPKPQIAAATVSPSNDLDDKTLLSEVEALEASQPNPPMDTAESHTKNQSSPKSEGIVETEPYQPELAPCSVKPFSSESPSGQVEPSQPKTLSELRAKPSLGERLLQPDEYPLPKGWKASLPEVDKKWISRALCRYSPNRTLEVEPTQLWYHPPQPHLIPSQPPSVDRYFAHSLLVWMPKKLWRVQLRCIKPDCNNHQLVRGGIYKGVRQVLNITDFYLMVTEKLQCSRCKSKYIAWSGAIVKQLDMSRRGQFPVILTYRYACDVSVVTLLRNRGMGNSAHQLQRKLEEQHHRRWLTQVSLYLSDSKGFTNKELVSAQPVTKPPSPVAVPKYKWLQMVYCIDVMSRLDEVKAAITSTFGRILKMDSTKKVAKKLAGNSRETATWATNVGNEDGLVLMSVLTCQEGYLGLTAMVDGIIQRYSSADVPPPEVLYVDKECCGDSCIRNMFGAWPDLKIRLDIWHFMRRFTAGCSTDAHQLYGVFMSRLSKCIFKWSSQDLKDLSDAKRSELQQRHLSNPSQSDILRWLTKNELALHCRRQTRGTEETTRLIGELLEAFMGDQGLDTLGVPLFDNEKMTNIWETQKKHVGCIQDPEGVSLYTKTGTLKKGSIVLPKYRCARGSVSLESFHNHLAKFIPGTTTSDTHYQAYLLDGLRRWNEDRIRQQTTEPTTCSYSGLWRYAVNDLSQAVLNMKLLPEFQAPRKYTGEKIGLEYLLAQTDKVLQDLISDTDIDNEDRAREEEKAAADEGDEDPDEGFEETEEEDPTLAPVDTGELQSIQPSQPAQLHSAESLESTPPTSPCEGDTSADSSIEDNQQVNSESETVDADNIEGYEKVNHLASYLFTLRNQEGPLSNDQADHIMRLWNNLNDSDKVTKPLPRHKTRLTEASTTTFKMRSRSSCVPGVDSVKRAFHGSEGGVAQRPNSNRYMELLIIKLCEAFPSPVKVANKRVDRWNQVARAYRHIRELIAMNPNLDGVTLYSINNATLSQWYSKRTKLQDKQMLERNIRVPEPPMSSDNPLPEANIRVPVTERPPVPPDQQHQFILPKYTVGTSGRVKKQLFISQTPTNPETTIQGASINMVPLQASSIQPCPVFFHSFPQPAISEKPTVAKSTEWYRKQKEKRKASGEYVRTYTQRRASRQYTCHKCMKPRDKETHTQVQGKWFCQETATESLEEFLAREKPKEKKCRKRKDTPPEDAES